MGYSLADVSVVFLSHAHWDHMGGLTEVLQDARLPERLRVVVHEGFSRRMRKEISTRATLVEVKGPEEIAPGVWSTGVLGKDVKEQALLVTTASGDVVITGCAHPGIKCILDRASELGRPTSIVGGFHSAQIADFPNQLERLVPCHCTELRDEMLKVFASKASLGIVGASYEFD